MQACAGPPLPCWPDASLQPKKNYFKSKDLTLEFGVVDRKNRGLLQQRGKGAQDCVIRLRINFERAQGGHGLDVKVLIFEFM